MVERPASVRIAPIQDFVILPGLMVTQTFRQAVVNRDRASYFDN